MITVGVTTQIKTSMYNTVLFTMFKTLSTTCAGVLFIESNWKHVE